jgi:uncharacterized protein
MRPVFLLTACICVSLAHAAAQTGDGAIPGDTKRFAAGVAAFDAGDYQAAFKTFQGLADDGDVAAMRNVALMERKGIGTRRDPKAALTLYEYVAALGLATGEYDLAEMLIHGEAGAPNPQAAVPLLQRAAASHHALAEYQLGVFYEEGRYVKRDKDRAANLYAQAAEGGVWDAKVRLAALEGWPAPKPPPPAPGLEPAEPVSPGP